MTIVGPGRRRTLSVLPVRLTGVRRLTLAAAVLAGCARLPAGPTNLVPPRPATRAGEVYLVRGFQDWYSTGIDALADDLTTAGVNNAVYREEQWGDLADALIARPPTVEPLVLIGFSYGADDVIAIARRLDGHGRRVDLLVTIDPVTPADVPANVGRCVSFYQPNGVWDLLPFLRGVPVHADRGAVDPENVDVRTRPDLAEADTSHATIAANPKVHRAIVELVRRTCPVTTGQAAPRSGR